MKIANIAAATTVLVNKEISTRIWKLNIDQSLASVLPVTTATEIKAAIAAAFPPAAKLTITYQGGMAGTPFRSISIADILELSANNGGTVRVESDGTTLRVRGSIEFSNHGAVQLNEAASIMLNIEGKVSAAIMDVYAMDTNTTARNILDYQTRAFEAAVPKDQNCEGVACLGLPIEVLDTIELFYKNGQKVLLPMEEVKQLLMDGQKPVIMANGKIYIGYFNFAVLNVEECINARITFTAATNAYIVRVKHC